MKFYGIEIYDDETNDMIEKIKNEKDISYSDQFRRGLKLLFAELEKENQEKEKKKTPLTVVEGALSMVAGCLFTWE